MKKAEAKGNEDVNKEIMDNLEFAIFIQRHLLPGSIELRKFIESQKERAKLASWREATGQVDQIKQKFDSFQANLDYCKLLSEIQV